MLQRNRSISLPKYAGDIIFQSESDFHSDVYDDTADDAALPPDMKAPPMIAASSGTSKTSVYIIGKLLATLCSGSISSVFFMMLLKEDPGSSLLAAFVLHLCVIIASLPTAGQHIFSPKIPYYRHGMIVCLSFGFVFLKSYAVQMLPMHIIFVMSNLQLVIGLFVGKYLFEKRFSMGQHIAVVLICVGCTLQTLPTLESSEQSEEFSLTTILLGILLMGASMLSMSIMIPFGSKMVQQYDANVQEQMFLQHFLSMPLFALQHEKISAAIYRVCNGDSYLDISGFIIPTAVLLLIATSALGQFNRNLSMELSLDIGAMSSQLVNTVHKTISLLLSLFFFNSTATSMTILEIMHSTSYYIWAGLVVQTVGSIWYVQSSYTENPKSTFRPSKSANRLSRVSFTGETKLGLSTDDISRLRKLAYDHRRVSAPNLTTLVDGVEDGDEDEGDEGEGTASRGDSASTGLKTSSHAKRRCITTFQTEESHVSVPNVYRKRRAATAGATPNSDPDDKKVN
jgi:drug/metabolite transporter (DMT)-like permease